MKLKPGWNSVCHILSVQELNGSFLILKGDVIVVPQSLRQRILSLVHDTHMGVAKMKAILRAMVF
jgi:hypothetical protein